ncbi:hypothetical protein ACROYT_G000896 [Oculina patagonica]
MEDVGELFEAIFIGTVVANFLFKTCRILKGIEVCEECLILLNNKALIKEGEVIKLFCKNIYALMVKAFSLINDNTSATQYHIKLLVIQSECGEKAEESDLTIKLENFYLCKDTKTCDRKGAVPTRGKLENVIHFLDEDRRFKVQEAASYGNLGSKCLGCGDFLKAKEYIEKALAISREICDRDGEATNYGDLGTVFLYLGEYDKAKRHLEKALAMKNEIGDREGEATFYVNLGGLFQYRGELLRAKEYLEKALAISQEIGSKNKEAASYQNLGTVLHSLGEYDKAKEYLEKALVIKNEIGSSEGEAAFFSSLANVCHSLGEYAKAKDYFEKGLAISIDSGNKYGEASCYGGLGTVLQSLGEYARVKEYFEKALRIMVEIGNKRGMAANYERLGTFCQYVAEYAEAKNYLQKALVIVTELSDRQGEASAYGLLGEVFGCLSDYTKAAEYLEKALAIRKEIGDKQGEAKDLGNLGNIFSSRGEYERAKEFIEKALVIRKEIGDRPGEATDCANLAIVLFSQGELVTAKEYLEEALAINIGIGDRLGEAQVLGNLGAVLLSLGEYAKAKDFLVKALALKKELKDREGEAADYGKLGMASHSLGEYFKAQDYLEKGLAIEKDIGNRRGEASFYGNLGTVFQSVGDLVKAEECFQEALTIAKEIGEKKVEAVAYGNLGNWFQNVGECVKAEEHLEKALAICKKFGYSEEEFTCHCKLAWVKLLTGKIQEAFQNVYKSIQKSEQLRCFLGDNDQFKLHFSDKRDYLFGLLKTLFLVSKNPFQALCVSELARARALADLMSAQYNTGPVSVNPQSWVSITNIMKKESHCTCLYISCFSKTIFLSILRTSGRVSFRSLGNIAELYANKVCVFSTQKNCEDRSLLFLNEGQPKADEVQKYNVAEKYEENEISKQNPGLCDQSNRLVEEDEDNEDHEPSLALYYKVIISHVFELLEEPEIIIVPDSCLYKVPFAALPDDNGKYLSEAFRIRIVPSLTTLKLIQDSPTGYHSQTGALIVGDPMVGQVFFKGSCENISRLPFAGKEAEMIGKLLDVQPLLGEHATKQAVLQKINSVSLIHFAAHGDAERGEIALAPVRTANRVPQEEDYLLTMSEISRIQVRAKLVVLSCCHSASGRVRAEGVVGIARAFLGSGARSVLVALWAIQDSATEQFMRHFYEHLVRGESASECLHEAMRWMRANGYSDVRQWAPFMLIGDNVTFDFGK